MTNAHTSATVTAHQIPSSIRDEWQEQNSRGPENQRPQKGYGGRHKSVVQRRKKGGQENIDTSQQERRSKQPESMARQRIQSRIVAHEQMCQRNSHHHSDTGQQGHPPRP